MDGCLFTPSLIFHYGCFSLGLIVAYNHSVSWPSWGQYDFWCRLSPLLQRRCKIALGHFKSWRGRFFHQTILTRFTFMRSKTAFARPGKLPVIGHQRSVIFPMNGRPTISLVLEPFYYEFLTTKRPLSPTSFLSGNRCTLSRVALIDKMYLASPIILVPRKSIDPFSVKVVKCHDVIGRR